MQNFGKKCRTVINYLTFEPLGEALEAFGDPFGLPGSPLGFPWGSNGSPEGSPGDPLGLPWSSMQLHGILRTSLWKPLEASGRLNTAPGAPELGLSPK